MVSQQEPMTLEAVFNAPWIDDDPNTQYRVTLTWELIQRPLSPADPRHSNDGAQTADVEEPRTQLVVSLSIPDIETVQRVKQHFGMTTADALLHAVDLDTEEASRLVAAHQGSEADALTLFRFAGTSKSRRPAAPCKQLSCRLLESDLAVIDELVEATGASSRRELFEACVPSLPSRLGMH
ncbi:hypothetical protein ACTQ49_05785 [Luteococcus sp. Sow4_B9]|uniref:hypothetical protein n=1 Tax=Luteococcus sp. Sow4_B9 TaxID=3438792 RepID=UPI003F9AE5CF